MPDGDDSDAVSQDDSEDENGEDLDGQGGSSSTNVSGFAPGAAADTGVDNGASPHKFMPPIEVELQMQQLWKKEHGVLDLIFACGRASAFAQAEETSGRRPLSASAAQSGVGGGVDGGHRLFFVRALAVPPPRFRPPMNMGDFIAEHPQNVYLTKVSGVGRGKWGRRAFALLPRRCLSCCVACFFFL